MNTERFKLTENEARGLMKQPPSFGDRQLDRFWWRETQKLLKAQVARVFSMLEPVELEGLGDEETHNAYCRGEGITATIDQTTGLRDGLRAVSQATIQHNQAKGQLYRMKEG